MRGLEPSLLDKLLDDDPRNLASVARSPGLSLEKFKASIADDLEGLLNCRAAFQEAQMSDHPECRTSMLTYGLADFSMLSLHNAYDRASICRSLERAVARHEKRLRKVTVTLEPRSALAGGLHFTIRALLDVEPAREPVSFNAMLKPSTLQYRVSGTQAARAG